MYDPAATGPADARESGTSLSGENSYSKGMCRELEKTMLHCTTLSSSMTTF